MISNLSRYLILNNITNSRIISAFDSVERNKYLPSDIKSDVGIEQSLLIASSRYILDYATLAHILKLIENHKAENIIILGSQLGYLYNLLIEMGFLNKIFIVEENSKLYDLTKEHINSNNILVNSIDSLTIPKNSFCIKTQFSLDPKDIMLKHNNINNIVYINNAAHFVTELRLASRLEGNEIKDEFIRNMLYCK